MAPSTATVLIGCKLPLGIILELITEPEPAKPGQPQALQPAPPGPRFTIAGSNTLRTDRRSAQAEHVYATTRIPKDFWDEWMKRPGNREMAFIKNGQLFVVPSGNERDAASEAKERQGDVKTGMEPLNPKGDARLPKSNNPNTTVEADPASLKPRDPDARPTA